MIRHALAFDAIIVEIVTQPVFGHRSFAALAEAATAPEPQYIGSGSEKGAPARARHREITARTPRIHHENTADSR
jgi:hypothetical protein